MQQKRIAYLDHLRIIATFGVIILHVAAPSMYSDFLTTDWQLLNFFNSCTRWTVPVFVMISGVFFLDPLKNIPIKQLYTKNILRIVISFIAWSTFYFILEKCIYFYKTSQFYFSLGETITTIVGGHYHLWFLFMIVGLYMATPIFRSICQQKETIVYFLIFSFVFNILYNTIFKFAAPLLPESSILTCLQMFDKTISTIAFNSVMGYSFYFVLGYYLHNYLHSKKWLLALSFTGLIGFGITYGSTHLATSITGELTTAYDNLTLGVMLESVGIFALAKLLLNNANLSSFVKSLSRCSFGIYLIHAAGITIAFLIMDKIPSVSPILYVPIISLLVFAVSFLISYLLNNIPFLNRYIV